MRQLNSLSDVNIAVRDLQDRMAKMETKNIDLHGRRLQNAGDGIEASDYVTLAQLPTLVAQNPIVRSAQNYVIVWNPPDSEIIDNHILVPRYIVGRFRVGVPVAVYVYAAGAPSGGSLKVDIMWNSNILGSTETNLLLNPLALPTGQNGPVTSSQLNAIPGKARPTMSFLSTLRPKIVLASGATGVTIELEVLRMDLRDV